MLARILNDIFTKLGLINIQSASETGQKGAGFGTVEETQWVGRFVFIKSHAAAETSRGFGGIIQLQNSFARGHACMTPEQRTGRIKHLFINWLVACNLSGRCSGEIDKILDMENS